MCCGSGGGEVPSPSIMTQAFQVTTYACQAKPSGTWPFMHHRETNRQILSTLLEAFPQRSHLDSCFTRAKATRNNPLEKKDETTVNFCSPADMKELKKAETTLSCPF